MVREVSTCVAAQGVLRNDQAGQAAGEVCRGALTFSQWGQGGFPEVTGSRVQREVREQWALSMASV